MAVMVANSNTALLQVNSEVDSNTAKARARASMARKRDTAVNLSNSSTEAMDSKVPVAMARKPATEDLRPKAAKATTAVPRITTTTSTTSMEAHHNTALLQARAATVALQAEVTVVNTAVHLAVAMAASREGTMAHSSPVGSVLIRTQSWRRLARLEKNTRQSSLRRMKSSMEASARYTSDGPSLLKHIGRERLR